MATSQELLSLQRKIALDSYHQTTRSNKSQRRSTTMRPRSLSGADSNKAMINLNKSNKSNKSRSKDPTILQTKPTTSHLPSMTKPFKKIFKRPNKQEISSDNYIIGYGHSQSRSFSNNSHSYSYKKSKSKKSKPKYLSDSQLSISIKKLIDKKLLIEYKQYVEERVEMLRSGAFPHEVIYQLSQYRSDLTDRNKSINKPYFSIHKEADELIQIDLLKAEKKALKHTTKLHNKNKDKQSKLQTIKKVLPIKPIKNLFLHKDNKIRINNMKTSSPQITHLSYEDYNKYEGGTNINNLENKFNIISEQNSISDQSDNIENINKESTTSISNEPNVSISQISDNISSIPPIHSNNNNKMEVIKDNNEIEITPCPFVDNAASARKSNDNIEPQLEKRSQTVDVNILRDVLDKNIILRAKTCVDDIENESHNNSPTPPFFKVRTNNIRNMNENIFENNIRSNTPSWALRDSTHSSVDINDIDNHNHNNDEKKYNELELKYNELELLCQELQINLSTMKENINEQNDTISLLTQQMNEMENKLLNNIKCVNNDNKNNNINKDIINIKENKNNINNNDNKYYFDYGYFLDMFKQKIFEEKDIISFERSKWENIYHSLFAYFMNGLMVIFTILMRLYMFIGFIFKFLLCCLCSKKNINHKYKNNLNTLSLSNGSRNVKRRNKKRMLQMRRKNSRNKNIWSENNDQQDGDT